ncbi:RagB/SusD family nutrient uptake outer membrane protein [Bacteroides uniformis]|nr:RagB/SusD family nutrient uptake outer membrane protein [Bacteroides uniformis]
MVGKHNLYWPIPNAAITKNIKGKLRQNVGYEGYDPTVPVFETWEEAVADEDKVD